MHVCLDIRKLRDSGIGTYIRGLLQGFGQIGADLQCDFITRPKEAPAADLGVKAIRTFPSRTKNYSLTELFAISALANRSQAQLFHTPHYIIPLGLRLPLVVTIHDLIHLKFPQYFSFPKRAYARWMLQRAVRQARIILTVSECTKADLVRELRAEAEHILVCYNGIDPRYFQPLPGEQLEQFRQNQRLPRDYLLYVGNLKAHKNVSGLLHAWAQLAESVRPPLVLVGARIDLYSSLQRQAEELDRGKEVFFTGELTGEELACAYRLARGCVQPSWYEGFGLPPLEAMASGVPVAVSNRGSLPEIVGDAALIFDPENPEEMTAALEKLVTDTTLRKGLAQKGPEQARRYTWEKAARQTLEAYYRALECR